MERNMTDLTDLRRKIANRYMTLRATGAAASLILATLRYLQRLANMTRVAIEFALGDAVTA
jgi:hypothetical protein